MSDITRYTQSNRAAWDASAAQHAQGPRWQRLLSGFAQPGFSTFDATATALLQRAGIQGGRVVQVGCNIGGEVLSCHALGAAACWGIDISAEFLHLADRLNQQAGHPARFVQADVYALPDVVPRDFDIALITIGVLNWMPDLPAFFRAVGGLLVPGGRLVVYETHPFLDMFEPAGATPHTPTRSYFRVQPDVLGQARVYDGSQAGAAPPSYWFAYPLGDVVTASVRAGFALKELREFAHCNREAAYLQYEGQGAQMPLCYTVLSRWAPASG